MRHGKTFKQDNESDEQLPSSHLLNIDPPKSTQVNLHASEYNSDISNIYQTIGQIKLLWYKTIRLYCPEDSNRNTQTTQLIQQYGKELWLTIIIDWWFEWVQNFGARKKIDRNLVTQLLSQWYVCQKTYNNINDNINGEKHILGKDKILSEYLSSDQLNIIRNQDSELHAQVIKQVEEAYTSSISRSGQTLDQLTKYITEIWKIDEYHMVVWYRTTIQALDKKFTQLSPEEIDVNYTCWFGEMHIATLNKNGNTLAEHKELRLPNPTTYESDITQLSQLDSKISLNNTVIANQNIINTYLQWLNSCITEHLKQGHTNLLLMYCKLGWLIRDLVVDHCYESIRSDKTLLPVFQKFFNEYCTTIDYKNHDEVSRIFDIIYQNKDIDNSWMNFLDLMWHDNRIKLNLPITDTTIQSLIWLYAQKESYLTGSNKHLLQVKSIDGWEMIDLNEIYVEQTFISNEQNYTTTQIAEQIWSQAWTYILHAQWWEGKSTSIKAIVSHILKTQNPPPLVTFISPSTDLDELENSDLPQLLVLDSLDELGAEWDKIFEKLQNISSTNKNITILLGTRVLPYSNQSLTIFSPTQITEQQKNAYVEQYLNNHFGTCEWEHKDLMEQTISKLWLQATNPLMIAMIASIMEDDNLSLELEKIQTKSDLYKIIIKILKQKAKFHMTKEEKKSNFNNPYKGDKFDHKRITLLWEAYTTNGHLFWHRDDFLVSDLSDREDRQYVTSTDLFNSEKKISNFIDQFNTNTNSELINSLFQTWLLTHQQDGSTSFFHKSLLDYAWFETIIHSINKEELIANLLYTDIDLLEDDQEDIEDEFNNQFTSQLLDDKITNEQYYDQKFMDQQYQEYINNLVTPKNSSAQKTIDIIYFNGQKDGDYLMNIIIKQLYEGWSHNRLWSHVHGLLITWLISAIQNNNHIMDKSIIQKLELFLNPELTSEDIKNYFDTMPIEYRSNMWVIDRWNIKIKWKWIAICASIMWFETNSNRRFYGGKIEGKKSFIAQLYHIEHQPKQELTQEQAQQLIRNINNEEWLNMSKKEKDAYIFEPHNIKLREIIGQSWYLEDTLWKDDNYKTREALKYKILADNNEFAKFITFCWKKTNKKFFLKKWIDINIYKKELIIKQIVEKWKEYRINLSKDDRKKEFNFQWDGTHAIFNIFWLDTKWADNIHNSQPKRKKFLEHIRKTNSKK